MRTAKEIKAEIEKTVAAGRHMNNLQNEGGEGYNHINQAKLDELYVEFKAADFAENWSLDQTISKRAAWSVEIKASIVGGKVPATALPKTEKKLGFRLDDLKKAIATHNLK